MGLRICFSIVAILVFAPSVAVAQDGAIENRLDKSRKKYDTAVQVARKELLTLIERRETAAIRIGDKKLAEVLAFEREALEKNDTLPKTVSISKYQTKVIRAATMLEADYKYAIREYTKDHKSELANAIEKQLIDLYQNHFVFWRHPKGSFEKQADETWIELSPRRNRHTFREIRRTIDFVELADPSRRCRVKLYVDRCDVSFAPYSTSKTFYRGGWTAR